MVEVLEGVGDGLVAVGVAVCDGSGLGNGVVVGVGEEVVLGSGVATGLGSTVVVGVGEGLSTIGLVEGLGSGEETGSEVTEGEGSGAGD